MNELQVVQSVHRIGTIALWYAAVSIIKGVLRSQIIYLGFEDNQV